MVGKKSHWCDTWWSTIGRSTPVGFHVCSRTHVNTCAILHFSSFNPHRLRRWMEEEVVHRLLRDLGIISLKRFLSSFSSPSFCSLFFCSFMNLCSNIYPARDHKHMLACLRSWKYPTRSPTWPPPDPSWKTEGGRSRRKERRREGSRSWGLMAFPSLW